MSDARKPLADKVAILTGGASGIGRALAEELASRGCEVVLADRQQAVASEVAKGIEERGGRATAAELDVRSLPAFQAVVAATLSRSGRVDYFFNNAGIAIGGEMDAYEPEDWDDIIDVNLRGVAYGIQAVYPVMVRQGSGHIINTASMAELIPGGGEGGYGATKHAVVGLSKALRVEAKQHGVRTSVLCPGAIRTPILTGGVFGRVNLGGVSNETVMRLWERTRPMAPADFARRAIDAVLKNEAIIVLPSWWKALWYLDRLSPSLSLALSTVVFARLRAELAASVANGGGEKPRG